MFVLMAELTTAAPLAEAAPPSVRVTWERPATATLATSANSLTHFVQFSDALRRALE